MSRYSVVAYLMGKEIVLYTLNRSKKHNLYCRFKNPTGETTYIRRSLKTSDESIATKRAIDLYNDMNAKVRLGAGVTETTWDYIYKTFEDELSPRRRELASQFNERWWKPYFSDNRKFDDLYMLNSGDLKAFWNWRINFYANQGVDNRTAAKQEFTTSPTTLRLEAYTLKFFLVNAYNRNLISQLPKVIYDHSNHPLVSKLDDKQRRGRFDDETTEIVRRWWSRTRRMLNSTADKPYEASKHNKNWMKEKDERVVFNHPFNRYSLALTYNITILVANTGIRPVEVVKLKWSDIELFVDPDDGTEFSVIQIRKGVSKVKKHRDAVARDFKETYNRLMEFKREWTRYFGREPDGEDYVFANARHKEQTRPCKPHQSVRNILKKLDKQNPEASVYYQVNDGVNVPRTLYSFRSLFITSRLRSGMDAFTLARACGTSIEMIERYYDYNKNIVFRKDITRHYKTFEFSGDSPSSE